MAKRKSKKDAHLEEPDAEFMTSLLIEKDRGCVLVGAAHIESKLAQLLLAKLKSSFVNQSDVPMDLISKLFNPKQPNALLGTFWSKLALARVFGLIEKGLYETIDCLRSLRNDFAHSPSPIALDDKSIEGLVSTYIRWHNRESLDWNSSEHQWKSLYGYKGNYSNARREFMGVCHSTHFELYCLSVRATHWPSFPRTLPDIKQAEELMLKRLEKREISLTRTRPIDVIDTDAK